MTEPDFNTLQDQIVTILIKYMDECAGRDIDFWDGLQELINKAEE